ncbi:dTDP-4-dehydrorhamnose 3,5-epimerase [Paenibacillus sp. GCM10012307]|uniref:dTDP-4-dehydrorhamnose 3,5-epimerase n=1 Tax=Paenibacillus roseus TaxID=2798579 RepID=A0A934J4M2_9BACL|nr:dTDP-4-dehydrorhamnose 3,5-epimerase [Paenibacillus roseus]MBJ6360253.1 dTDP-4-dehydrorhamnose 3,5-epimerase [Paenibacillus roseus]
MQKFKTELDGVWIIEPTVHQDNRGFFIESYSKRSYEGLGISQEFVQDNHSLSKEAGTLRGLHYQRPPYAQGKLVRVLAGAIYDVAVDIRSSSPTFGQWVGVILSADNYRQLWIPQGFAHGFCTLVPDTQVSYKVDQYYNASADRGIAWNDPELAIPWPVNTPLLSGKDGAYQSLSVIDQEELFP